jgi:predicted alpha/beta-hydrolase family hydrolase
MRSNLPSIPLQEVRIPCGAAWLHGDLALPGEFIGVVLFAHGSGSGRHSAGNRLVARGLHQSGIATLLFDLLTAAEEEVDLRTREHRFDIALLTRRMEEATAWAGLQPALKGMPIGLFGASTGGAAALIAAAQLGTRVSAVVSRSGRTDLAGPAALAAVTAPTLLVAGGADPEGLRLNEQALAWLQCTRRLVVVPGAGRQFEDPASLEQVADLAAAWFSRHLLRTEHLA